MRLYKRNNGFWYIEHSRTKHRSLKTKDAQKAKKLFREIERHVLLERVLHLDIKISPKITDYIDEYCDSRADFDHDTLRADRLSLRTLADTIGNVQLRMIDAEKIDQFKSMSLARGLKPVSINTYLRHIKAALNVAAEKNYMVPIRFKMVKTPKHLPRILTKNEIKRLQKKADKDLYRFITFALYTGCRREEILNVKWQDVTGDVVRITGKGDKQRFVKLVPKALKAMGNRKDIGSVFPQWHKDNLSKEFTKLARRCGITDVHFHSLRHTSATQMLESGIPLEKVQKILGHQDIRITQIYTQISDESTFREMEKLKF
jgi:integrase